MLGIGAYYELAITCRGEIDPRLGYLVDIQTVDRAARASLVPAIARAVRSGDALEPGAVLVSALPALDEALDQRLVDVRWSLSPHYSVEASMTTSPSRAAPTKALLRQRFDFAAAHRLHCPELSDADNRRLFGKCNNPNGHGHNYQFEPCVEIDAGPGSYRFSLQVLERLADDLIIRRFDHMHLNEDTLEFRRPGGLNPSVENIAKVIFELLKQPIEDQGGRLRGVTVWETDRTSATYPADDR